MHVAESVDMISYNKQIHHICMHAWIHTYDISIYLPANLSYPIYLSTYLPTYLPIYLPTYLPIYLSIIPIYLSKTCNYTHANVDWLVHFYGLRQVFHPLLVALPTHPPLFQPPRGSCRAKLQTTWRKRQRNPPNAPSKGLVTFRKSITSRAMPMGWVCLKRQISKRMTIY